MTDLQDVGQDEFDDVLAETFAESAPRFIRYATRFRESFQQVGGAPVDGFDPQRVTGARVQNTGIGRVIDQRAETAPLAVGQVLEGDESVGRMGPELVVKQVVAGRTDVLG